MHKTLFPRMARAPRNLLFTPSAGKHGSFSWITDRYYVRFANSFRAISKETSMTLREQLEHRNKTVAALRVALCVALILAAAFVIGVAS